MLFISLILLSFRAALESTSFQNWLVGHATNYLSKELNTKVEVGHVDFSLFNSILLENVLIEDNRGDTLLYVGTLEAKLRSNLSALIRQDIDVKSINLYDAKFIMHKDTSMLGGGNMSFLLNTLGSATVNDSLEISLDSLPKKDKPLLLNVENLGLYNMIVESNNKTKGEKMEVWLAEGNLSGINFNAKENHLAIDEIVLDEFHFHYFKGERQLPPPIKEYIDKDTSYQYFTASANNIQAIDGHFKFIDLIKESKRLKFENTMDFNDLDVEEINAEIDSFWMREDLWFKGSMRNMEAKEKSGFVLMPSYANDVEVTCEGLHLYDMQLNTPTTTLGDSLEMKYRRYGYPSFLTFVDDVRLAGKFKKGSKISVEDIFTFAPELQNNKFFRNSQKEVLQVEGEISGDINGLKTKGFLLKIGDRLTMKGDLRSRNITVKEEEFFDFELENLTTNIASLRALIADFNAPKQFDKLGKLRFKGRFTGFLSSFTADGFLRTELGNIQSNLTLDGKSSDAKYNGSLALIDFDLGTWIDNPDLGLVNFSSEVKNGVGLDLDHLSADLSAKVSSLNFKGYKYEALNVNGKFFRKNFEGNLNIKDENIDLNFDGLVDLNGEVPVFRFKAFVNNLKLKELNLTPNKSINLKAELDLDFQGFKLQDLEGEASARKIELLLDTVNLELDSIYAEIKRFDGLKKKISIRSEVLRGSVEGEFEIDELPKILASYAQRNFPELTNKVDIDPKLLGFNEPRYFDYEFIIENSKNFTQFISPKLDTIFNSNIAGYFDSRIDSLELNSEIEKISYDGFELDLINVSGAFKKDSGVLYIGIYHTLIVKDSINISNVSLKNKVNQDTFNFEFELNDPVNVLDALNLNGSLTLDDEDYFKVNFKSSNLVILNHKWEILKDNAVRFGKGLIETENFKVTNLDIPSQKIELNSIGEKGLQVLLQGLDISILNSYINYDKFILEGPIDIQAEVADVFTLKELKATVNMDSLFINEEYFGELDLSANSSDMKSPVEVNVNLKKGEQTLFVKGNYYLPFFEANPDYLDLDIDIKNFPLSFSEAFLGENVSNTYGDLDGQLKLKGKISALELTGDVRVYDAATTVNYLQTTIYIPDHKIEISNGLIDLAGLEVYDKEGNKGLVTRGGITKNNLKDFGLDIDLKSEKFIAMDTKEEDNEAFYGRGIGSIDAEFRGDFANTQMKITTTTAPGTKVFLPITSSRSGSELSFITFNSDIVALDSSTFFAEDLKGLDLELNLNITPDAEVQLVIDQNAGDILKGKGTGELQINVTKEGDFTMEGVYNVEQGHYLFTLLNVVNKPFVIKKGGTIKWSGDPLGAIINLEATYENLSATPYNFILEYLNEADEKSNAQRTTPVDLTMKLQGELFKPDISFDISFPSLRGRLRNYTDSKLRIITEDENELNRQVLGLIAFGSFFPSDLAYSSSGLLDGGINTLSELLSNQLSIYISELLSEVITDVDIDFNYRYYEYTEITDEEDILRTGNELEIRLKKGLFNNRLVINAGSNIDVDGGTTSSAFLAGDLLIEYLLTPDGKFKLRFYSEWDETISGTQNQTGVGFTYRKDFDKFSELFKKNRKNTFKIEKEYNVFLDNLRKAAAESIEN